MKYKLLEYMPPHWRQWFIDFVTVEEGNLPFAAVRNDADKGIVLIINFSAFDKLNDDQKRALIEHEIGHIVRGDIFKQVEDRDIWNMVWDAVINQTIDNEIIRSMNGILYEDIKETLGLPKHLCVTSEFEIFQALKKQKEEEAKALEELLQKMGQWKDVLDSVPLDKMGLEGRIQVYRALLAASEIAKNYEGAVKVGIGPGNKQTVKVTKLRALPIIEQLLKLCLQSGRKFIKHRSFRREGITPCLRGMSRKRIGKIFLLVDVSGSVINLLPKMLGLAQWLIQKRYVVEFGTFSSGFKHYPTLPSLEMAIEDAGGGTEIKEALNFLAKSDYDLAIIITDGEIFDYEEELAAKCPFPLVWVLTQDTSLPIPKKDFKYVIPLDKED